MRSPTSGLKLGQALVLGALHGPAELLPVSSSAHTETIPLLLGWDYAELEPGLRKAFDVALHAGTLLALATRRRDERSRTRKSVATRRRAVIGLAAVPPALIGFAFEGQIERRLGTPVTIAAALLGGAVVMVVADGSRQDRRIGDAAPRDGVWLGVAQACALVPGVSRAGATRSAARLLGFQRADAAQLSEEVGLPVLAGATLLKSARLHDQGVETAVALNFAAAIAASFASTLASSALLRRDGRLQRLLPFAIYRIALAGLILGTRRRRSTAPAARAASFTAE